MNQERLESSVRKLFAGFEGAEGSDPWLWDYTSRILKNAACIRAYPSLKNADVDEDALTAAALFHVVGLAEQTAMKELPRWQLLVKPLSDVQRELAANALHQHARGELTAQSLRLASDAIRQYHVAEHDQIEAKVLCDAINLDEVGVLYVVRQIRLYQAEHRSLEKLVEAWKRQREYDFWAMRIDEGFRFEESRTLARQRVNDADAFIQSLDAAIRSSDICGETTD